MSLNINVASSALPSAVDIGGEVVIPWTATNDWVKETSSTVNLTAIWEREKVQVKNVPVENMKKLLVQGKVISAGIKRKASESGTYKVKFGEFHLKLHPHLEETDLNIQRLTALFALRNGMILDKNQKIQTAMGSAIPGNTVDARYNDNFHTMLAPGYGFLYKPLFIPTTATDVAMMPGDKGRYFAGAVEMDWLQACSGGKNITLREFAVGQYYKNMNGTVKQIVTNSGASNLDMTPEELAIFQAIVGRNVNIATGKSASNRVEVAVANWKLAN